MSNFLDVAVASDGKCKGGTPKEFFHTAERLLGTQLRAV